MRYRISSVGIAIILHASISPCQTPSNEQTQDQENKRILGIVPNYRTSPSLTNYEPLTVGQKFKLASEDSSDRGTIALAVLFGGELNWPMQTGRLGKGQRDSAATSAPPTAIS